MSYTPSDMGSAIGKLSTLDFTDAELEAIAAVLDESGEVEAFNREPVSSGYKFLLDVSGLISKPSGSGVSDLDLGSGRVKQPDGFTATDDLWK
ncbi:MAG: hypothetical protein ACC652_14215 [Acidimicrobiales bacterium]